MAYKLACKDMGIECPFVAQGKTMDELMGNAAKHGKEVHGYTDEQLKDPKMQKEIKAAVKEE
ncbi:MAG: DUF1059 domain-containing protein [Methanosarcinales archaeon]|jgi:predicted small metal-binding protein|nr:MAG: putative small metal-binding protein [ANME-2 cluster archaeon]MCD4842194.1 DUF1059 domain-containing protein [Methanosarcinales archaeon]